VTLPSFGPDTTLVLRTTPGAQADAAWDWMYLASLRLHRSPRFLAGQFPGFNRMPDRTDADTEALLEDDPRQPFILRAPASLSYSLHGSERTLRIDYGLQPEAGATGVIFRIELHGEARPPRVLFERHLRPAVHAADRGLQRTELALPVLQAGDTLTLHTVPGSAGDVPWGLVYLSALDLK